LKNEGLPIVEESFPFLLVALGASLAFWVGGLWQGAVLGLLVSAYIAYFFRNPERLPPVGSAVVASPADGKVVFVGQAHEPDFTKQPMLKVSVFMSLIDVHVNRVPIDGTVRDVRYHRGRFMAASEDRASDENERNALLIETAQGEKLVLVQVAGLIARRIICYLGLGSFVLKGQRMGLIRFGSRCDLFLPLGSEILVKVGDRVIGGESILAKLASTAEASP
jgi:phosphatidylserine decarboxylase